MLDLRHHEAVRHLFDWRCGLHGCIGGQAHGLCESAAGNVDQTFRAGEAIERLVIDRLRLQHIQVCTHACIQAFRCRVQDVFGVIHIGLRGLDARLCADEVVVGGFHIQQHILDGAVEAEVQRIHRLESLLHGGLPSAAEIEDKVVHLQARSVLRVILVECVRVGRGLFAADGAGGGDGRHEVAAHLLDQCGGGAGIAPCLAAGGIVL